MSKLTCAELVWDTSLYPRQDVSENYVNQLVDSLRAGESVPPILVEKKSRRIIDGVHRWRAHGKLFGEASEIECELREFPSENDAWLAAVEANSAHGFRYTPFEETRCIILSEQRGISREMVARALRITVEKIERILLTKTAFQRDGSQVALKGSMHGFRGERLTTKQLSVNRFTGGMKPLYYINQLVGLLEAGIVKKLNEDAVSRLYDLRDLLDRILPVRRGLSRTKGIQRQGLAGRGEVGHGVAGRGEARSG